ncbi:MAG: hypothetical protein ACJA0H_000889, partial [Francisellaceae bacterium]
GVNTLLNEVDIDNVKNGRIKKGTDLEHSELQKKFSPIITRYKKIFKSENVIILPQWAYHLDLQMSYAGRSIFLLHSFEAVTSYIDSQRKHENKVEIREHAKSDIAIKCDKIIEYIKQILEYYNFQVIKFAGSLYLKKFKETQFECKPSYHDGGGLVSCLTNGIDMYDERSKKCYYLTGDSIYGEHKNYLINLLKPHEIKPVFLKKDSNLTDPRAISQANSKALASEGGGLRCQTNFIPDEMLGEILSGRRFL